MNEKILSILLVLTIVFMLVACGAQGASTKKGDSDLSYVKGNGKLVIGYTDYAPMNYTDESGTFTGFDTELAILTCKNSVWNPNS